MARTDYEQERKLLIDITTPARSIERMIGHMLIPTKPGLYMPASSVPVITEDKPYFQYNEKKDVLKPYLGADLIYDRSLITSDLYTEDGSLFLRQKAVPFLSETPALPVRAIGIILELINNHLVQHFAFNSKEIDVAEHALDGYVSAEFNDPATVAEMASAIYDIHSHNRSIITDFMGDDHYKRHLVKLIGETALILKQNDYRILRFEELLNEGEVDAPKRLYDHTY
jgi:hypothetical protein